MMLRTVVGQWMTADKLIMHSNVQLCTNWPVCFFYNHGHSRARCMLHDTARSDAFDIYLASRLACLYSLYVIFAGVRIAAFSCKQRLQFCTVPHFFLQFISNRSYSNTLQLITSESWTIKTWMFVIGKNVPYCGIHIVRPWLDAAHNAYGQGLRYLSLMNIYRKHFCRSLYRFNYKLYHKMCKSSWSFLRLSHILENRVLEKKKNQYIFYLPVFVSTNEPFLYCSLHISLANAVWW